MQEFFVYLIVLGAVAYLARMLWSAARGKAGCSSCSSGGCGAKQPNTSAKPQLVQIDLGNLNGKH
jgi:hypothetical protein